LRAYQATTAFSATEKKGQVLYAVDADTGEPIWKVRVEDHRTARITGAPKLFERPFVRSGCFLRRGRPGAIEISLLFVPGKRGPRLTAPASRSGRHTQSPMCPADCPTCLTSVWSSPTIDPSGTRSTHYRDAYTSRSQTTDAIMAWIWTPEKIQVVRD